MDCLIKVLSISAVILLAGSISPTGDWVNPNDCWIIRQKNWIKCFNKSQSYPVSIDPRFLYAGVVFGVLGILLS